MNSELGIGQLTLNMPSRDSSLPSYEDHAVTKSPASNKQRFLKERVSFPGHSLGFRKAKSTLDLSHGPLGVRAAGYGGCILVTCCACGNGPFVGELYKACMECNHSWEYCNNCEMVGRE